MRKLLKNKDEEQILKSHQGRKKFESKSKAFSDKQKV